MKGRTMLNRKQAAEYLGCSVSYLEKKQINDKGAIPCSRIGRHVMYRLTDLDSFAESKRH